MTTQVNTVEGRKAAAELGRTLIHEHVLVGFPGWFMDARQPPFKRAEAIARAVDAFQELHAHGVRTVIDPCPMDLGRDVEFVAEVSQKSGITLICTTGVYAESMGIPYTMRALSAEAVTEIFVKEIEDGIGTTGIRAGLIKIATGDGHVTDYEKKMIAASARAAMITGVPLISHTENCSCGHDQIDIATGEGLAASSLIVGHSDGRDDHDYQRSLAERGAYVGFDRFGLEQIVPDAVRAKNLKMLADAGHKERIMVSHDTVNCWLGGLPGGAPPEALNQIAPNWRMTNLFERIFPELKAMGMSQADLDLIVSENPRRYFEEAQANARAGAPKKAAEPAE
jgi:phosphotriesterase-related protein